MKGIDFKATFSPTVSSSCVRLLSAIACKLDLDVCHFDVEQAFVQSKLDEDVFLRLPRGCGRLSDKVVRLNKSLYGLKQASGSSTRNFRRRRWQSLEAIPWASCLQISNLQESKNMRRGEITGRHLRMRHPWRLHLPRQPELACLCPRPPPSYRP